MPVTRDCTHALKKIKENTHTLVFRSMYAILRVCRVTINVNKDNVKALDH